MFSNYLNSYKPRDQYFQAEIECEKIVVSPTIFCTKVLHLSALLDSLRSYIHALLMRSYKAFHFLNSISTY